MLVLANSVHVTFVQYAILPYCAYRISLIRCRDYNFLLHVFLRLLFKGGIYFFGKPADTNDNWIESCLVYNLSQERIRTGS